ncbi:MAG: hypothetical protein ACREQV_16430 [Candidatus Binatia bacterium]
MPFTFIQDDLLSTQDFIKAATDRGYRLSLDDLQAFHSNRLLMPLYRVSDTPVDGRRIKVAVNGNMNDRWQALKAAQDGRLRDSAHEGYSSAWPYRRPPNEQGERWWNGFLYSSWQLLDLHSVAQEQRGVTAGRDRAVRMGPAEQRRRRVLALAALTPRYLPGVLGKLSIPPGIDEEELRRFRFEPDVHGLLGAVGFDPTQLRAEAENLLLHAMRDPLHKWLPLVRHASSSAWLKLQGKPLDCLWLRVGAEVLLRAHEELAANGNLEPLPDISKVKWHMPLHDRLSRTSSNAEPLEQVLGRFGLSPHPRVLILVEGETELVHFPLLLEQFGLSQPEQVRVQRCKGSGVNPQLLARYAISPRIGGELGDSWRLTATPTALVIAMDPENMWATPEKRDTQRKKIKKAIQEEVELQGGRIGDTELDFLVNIYVWREDLEYELANFTDDELLAAFTRLASGPQAKDKGSDSWQEETRQKLRTLRDEHANINTVVGPLRIKKPELAEILWPALLAKCERELETDVIETPILKVILEVQRLAGLLSGGSYILPKSSVKD